MLDYASARAALDRFVGHRITARIATNTGASVAAIGVGYLQSAGQFGEPPADDEVMLYTVTEQEVPAPGYHRGLAPDVRIHNVPDFEAWASGARVDCRFSGVTVTVELADADEWRAAERT